MGTKPFVGVSGFEQAPSPGQGAHGSTIDCGQPARPGGKVCCPREPLSPHLRGGQGHREAPPSLHMRMGESWACKVPQRALRMRCGRASARRWLGAPHACSLQAHGDSAQVPLLVVMGTFPESVPLADIEALREPVSLPSVSDKRVCVFPWRSSSAGNALCGEGGGLRGPCSLLRGVLGAGAQPGAPAALPKRRARPARERSTGLGAERSAHNRCKCCLGIFSTCLKLCVLTGEHTDRRTAVRTV